MSNIQCLLEGTFPCLLINGSLCLGNPSVVLIDEFSTGIDAKMKRDMWGTLKSVAIGKAVVITTRKL